MRGIRRRFIQVGHAEGISFLVLLLIAMPLKYMADMPLAVRIAGSVHGILFIAFISVLWETRKQLAWSGSSVARAVLLAITPFGTFFLDRLMPGDLRTPEQ